jgi:hypothetical protein
LIIVILDSLFGNIGGCGLRPIASPGAVMHTILRVFTLAGPKGLAFFDSSVENRCIHGISAVAAAKTADTQILPITRLT